MNIHCCSFASESFIKKQNIQKQYFLEAGFFNSNIHLFNPDKLNENFYKVQPKASEINKFGWFSFKPYMLLLILEELQVGDILFYLDVNDKPLKGLINYIEVKFSKNKNLDLLAPLTNYPNYRFLSRFNKNNFSNELLFSSFFNFQPEAGALVVRNSQKLKRILWCWYNMTLILAYDLEKYPDLNSRHDQETLYSLSKFYNSIKFESWYKYKLTGKGLRKYIDFESLR